MSGRGYFYSRCKEHSSYYVSKQLEVDCPYCEIDRLRGMMEASTDNYSSLYKEWADSQKQLASARTENEKLKLLSISNKTYQCNYCGKSQCVVAPLNKEEIRQEAARKCLEIISMETIDRPFEQSQAAEIIKAKFKLEG